MIRGNDCHNTRTLSMAILAAMAALVVLLLLAGCTGPIAAGGGNLCYYDADGRAYVIRAGAAAPLRVPVLDRRDAGRTGGRDGLH